jgi:hypothetical protein
MILNGSGLDKAVSAIYDACLDETKLPSALTKLSDVLGGAGIYLASCDAADQRHLPHWSVTSDNIPPEPEADYRAHYVILDPRHEAIHEVAVGQTWACHEEIDDGHVSRSAFHQDFLLRYGYRWTLGARVLEANGESVFLVV